MRASFSQWRFDALLFCVVVTLLAIVVLPLEVVPGSFDDDGIYLSTAESLANGQSYRLAHLPAEPYQTKYPPLFPLMLSLSMRLDPAWREGVWFLLWPIWLATALAAVLWRRLLMQGLGLSSLAATCAVLGSVLCTELLGFLTMVMSEMPFAVFLAAALLVAGQRHRVAAPASGFLAGLATLTRSIGIAVPAGVGLWLALQRRWREALLHVGTWALTMSPWWLWQARANAANASWADELHYAYDLDYTAWFLGLGEAIRVAWINLVQNVLFLCSFSLPGSSSYLVDWASRDATAHKAIWFVALVIMLAFVCGLWRIAREARHPLVFAMLAYFGAMIVWPFNSARFYLPVLPIVAAVIGRGVAGAFAEPRRRRVVEFVTAGHAVVAVVLFAIWLPGRKGVDASRIGNQKMLSMIEENFAPGELVSAPLAPMITLNTRHKCVRTWPADNPLDGYPRGRSLWDFYANRGEAEVDVIASPERMRAILVSLRELGVRRFVIGPGLPPNVRFGLEAWTRKLALPIEAQDADTGVQVVGLRGVVYEHFIKGG